MYMYMWVSHAQWYLHAFDESERERERERERELSSFAPLAQVQVIPVATFRHLWGINTLFKCYRSQI